METWAAYDAWWLHASTLIATVASLHLRETPVAAATTRLVRGCYATDKLGIALGATGAGALRGGWWRWRLALSGMDARVAADEAETRPTSLSNSSLSAESVSLTQESDLRRESNGFESWSAVDVFARRVSVR